MDELELLKRDWQTSETKFQTYTDKDIYRMSHKKSSSIVKTLFYISVAEFVFWILVNILPAMLSEKMKAQMDEMMHSTIYVVLTGLSYGIILLFVYLLWKSYTSISVTDNAKKLMESILKTRKIIKYYVLYNLTFAFISIPVSFYLTLKEHPEMAEKIADFSNMQLVVLVGIIIIATAIFLGLIWLFYRLIYGILIKRLNRNYVELQKIEHLPD